MNRAAFSATVAAGAVAAVFEVNPVAAKSAVKNIVFVHGLYADGSCWSDVVALLQPRG